MYICIYIYIYVYIYICNCIYMYICVCAFIRMSLYGMKVIVVVELPQAPEDDPQKR